MERLIDLHTHSIYSDGEFTPLTLLELAKNKNIETISITDHNTIDAYKSFDYKNYNDVKIIPGVELSSKVEKGRMHILGYNIDPENKVFIKEMNKLKQISIKSVNAIINQIKKDYNINFPKEEVNKLLSSPYNIGRPDIAKLLIKYGYATTVNDAFNKYLIDAHNKTREYRKLLTYEECINLILLGGGIPVLAHPKSLELNKKDLLILLKNMISVGLKGIEVYHSSHSPQEIQNFLEISKKLNMLISGGSDYHGPLIKPKIELGTGYNGNIKIKKLSLIDKIKSD